jgi:hypothetical protein
MPLKMRRLLLPLGLLSVTGVALAIPWSGFDDAFDPLPCPDGWAACVISGQTVDPGMVRDSASRPHPANMRVGFFDLKPLPGFSPFVGLSEYTGDTTVAVSDPPEKVEPTPTRPIEPVAQNDPTTPTNPDPIRPDPIRPDPIQPDPIERPIITPTNPTNPTTTASTPSTTSTPTTVQPTSIRPDPVVSTPDPVEPDPVVPEPVTPTPVVTTPTPTPTPTPTQVNPTSSEPVGDPVTAAETPTPTPTRPVAEDNGCDDLVSLEAPAMMGNLGVGRRKCLESRISSSNQTTKNKISRVLISDAEARGDKAEWERLMKRHLEEIDRSDPNLCFTYAIHLSRGGVGRAHGVIRWADYALENKQQWSGTTYKKNVYALYKLRAQAANKLWEAAEAKYVEDRSDENEAAAKKYRDMTKNYGREWLDYARASGESTKSPLSLCVSAAGSTEFCEG